ncbi:ribosomal RNA methyltransferase FtsJ domain-containing protein [Powellomyces hirtus]|nr:ribosomal RNA methyltransferase FtsJ domain-containing protein [Powellomyces hirtus]
MSSSGGTSVSQLRPSLQSVRWSVTSPKQWISRQSRDPFVKQRAKDGYRSRAAYKLEDIQRKHGLMKKGMVVLDLGGCPGGWAQVAVKYAVRSPQKRVVPPDSGGAQGKVVSVDLLLTDPIPGATLIRGDMTKPSILEQIHLVISSNGPAQALCSDAHARKAVVDVVLSDMAHPFTGSRTADVAKVIELCELALSVAEQPGMLKNGGAFVCKFIQGEGDQELRALMKEKFNRVAYEKPGASRSGSAEGYLVCLGYKRDI